MDKNAVNQRFIASVNFLIETKRVPSKTFLSEKINISNSKFSEILKGRMNVGVDTLALFSEEFGISAEWLLTEKGQMLQSEVATELDIKNTYPFLTLEAFAGYGDEYATGVELAKITERYEIPLFRGLHVDFMIGVKGSSMYPKYNSGDVVACRLITELIFIQWNKVYVVDTFTQGIILKRLKPSKNDTSIVCKSDNESYDSFELPKSEIRKIALVVGVVRLE